MPLELPVVEEIDPEARESDEEETDPEARESDEDEEESDNEAPPNQPPPESEETQLESQYEDPSKNFITLGFIGHPNVGKSTLINALKGKKICSTSRTPGHTKYKQTVFLNDTVMLCDCPGLVFPACDVPKIIQIVCGIFNIAQVREPYSPIRFIAERVPLETIYKLEKQHDDQPWTPYEICEAYAEKRGYHTQKGRSDTHRAALEILRDHCDGRVVLYFTPNSTKINVGIYEEGAKEVTAFDDIPEPEQSTKVNKKHKNKT